VTPQFKIRLKARAAVFALLVALAFSSFLLGMAVARPQERLTENEVIARNSARLTSIEQRLDRIERWEDTHDKDLREHSERDSSVFSELKTKVEAHEWFLRTLGFIVIVLIIETVWAFVTRRKRENVKGN
jgi:hypothetical protein